MSHSPGSHQRSIIVLAEMDLFYYLFLDTLQIDTFFPQDRQLPYKANNLFMEVTGPMKIRNE